MNTMNNYIVSQKYNSCSGNQEGKFDGTMKVSVFTTKYQDNSFYSKNKISYSWGNALKEAIVSSNIDLIKHIVENCSNQIFNYHGMSGLVPLCHADDPKITQFLIDLGAEVNINVENRNGTRSPISHAVIYATNNKNKMQIVKCLLKNNANPEKVNVRYKNLIENLQREIAYEKEFVTKGASLLLSSKLSDSTFSEMQIPSELITLILQKTIDVVHSDLNPVTTISTSKTTVTP